MIRLVIVLLPFLLLACMNDEIAACGRACASGGAAMLRYSPSGGCECAWRDVDGGVK
jgi:hypothetical protein